MAATEFVAPLRGSPYDRYRHRHVSERGRITAFTIQYEAEIDGVWQLIVRYDTAHGRPHKDVLFPDGTQTKEEFLYHTLGEVLTLGQNDIRRHWTWYREQYEKRMRRRK